MISHTRSGSELVGFQFLLQRVTFDVLEHDKDAAVFLTPHVVHAHNRRVLLQAGDVTGLLQQTLDILVPRKPVSTPDLDGHVPLEFLVASAVDGAEAAAPQDADDLVSADVSGLLGRATRRCAGAFPRCVSVSANAAFWLECVLCSDRSEGERGRPRKACRTVGASAGKRCSYSSGVGVSPDRER